METIIVYAGVRVSASKGMKCYQYYRIVDGALGEGILLKKSADKRASLIGQMIKITEEPEGTFHIGAAGHIGWWDGKKDLTSWQAAEAAANSTIELDATFRAAARKGKLKAGWNAALIPIQDAYAKCRTRKERSGILAEVIQFIIS